MIFKNGRIGAGFENFHCDSWNISGTLNIVSSPWKYCAIFDSCPTFVSIPKKKEKKLVCFFEIRNFQNKIIRSTLSVIENS